MYKADYQKLWYAQNKERINAKRREQYACVDGERRRATARKFHNEKYNALRLLIFTKLGGVCNRCGFSDHRALQIDHVNSDGWKERSKGRGILYLKKVLNDAEGRYQLLCANCNWIKRAERSEQAWRERRRS